MTVVATARAMPAAINEYSMAVAARSSPNEWTKTYDAARDPHRSSSGQQQLVRGTHFKAVCTLVNVVLRVDPRLTTTVIIAIDMPAAISPYSMAVAPELSFKKRSTTLFMRWLLNSNALLPKHSWARAAANSYAAEIAYRLID
jgi:hypothetical protein